MQIYHHVWLSVHPRRTQEWLKRMLADGFHIHHMDGDHNNNEPRNLVLIEAGDHMMIHNGVSRLLWKPSTGMAKINIGRPKGKAIEKIRLKLEKLESKEEKKNKKSTSIVSEIDKGGISKSVLALMRYAN